LRNLKYWYLLLALGILIGIALAIPSKAQSPKNELSIQTSVPKPSELITSSAGTSNMASTSSAETKTSTPEVRRDNITPYDKEQVKTLIYNYSIYYGVNPDLPIAIAKCESGFNYAAKNRSSTASGVFQFIRGTWAGTEEGKQGFSPFDADANVRAAVRKISKEGTWAWEASAHCWKK
jgi:soluble lytic murein transglycosylase-like protein